MPKGSAVPSDRSGSTQDHASIFSYAGFRKLFFGSLCGAFADRLYFSALIAAANVIYFGSAVEDKKGQIQIYATIPLLILYGLSGSLIDSFNRRLLLAMVHAIKVGVVLLLAAPLWRVVALNPLAPDPALLAYLKSQWPFCLSLVVVLNIITVPFGPARAAAIPDVVPERHRSLGASLMATSGLVALLLAMLVGGYVARTNVRGPAWTVVYASCFYLFSAVLFSRLPDAVAVPGNKREKEKGDADAKPASLGAKAYIAGLWDGLSYCLRRPSIFGLIFFETCFWTIASAFYILVDFHARTVFNLQGNDLTLFSGVMVGAFAGVGLFSGALGVGRICGRVSPIVTYAPAFFLLAGAMYAFFHAPAATATGGAPGWVYPVMFLLGLGAGSLLGRVDADVLAIADGPMRGRVFSIKAVGFAATLLVTIMYLSEGQLSDAEKAQITQWMPQILFLLLPVALLFSWAVDTAIWSRKPEVERSGPLHRAGFALCRSISWLVIKLFFRYEVKGAENLPKTGPAILAANHASFIDPILLGCATSRIVQYTMYASYYRSFAHPLFRFLRCIPVDEQSTLAALKANVRSLQRGACIGIFPEGHVSDDGRLQPAQGGALFLAQRSGAPVVPVAIKGNYQALPRGAWIPRPAKITVIVGTPFTVDKDLSREQVAERAQQMMVDIASALGEPTK
ncbi:MAG TPA: MFS transporter [Planctomycetota bacterium]